MYLIRIALESMEVPAEFPLETKQEPSGEYFLLRFASRVARETFFLFLRVYNELRLQIPVKQLELLEKTLGDRGLFAPKTSMSPSTPGDLVLQVSNLRALLTKNVGFTKKVIEEKDGLNDYCTSLERDLHSALSDLKDIV